MALFTIINDHGFVRLPRGRTAFANGDYSSAEKHLEKALVLAEKNDETLGVCKIQNYLSNTYLDLKKYADAKQTSSEAVSSCSISNDSHDLVAAYANLASAYQYMGDSQNADTSFDKALDVAKQKFSPDDTQVPILSNNYGTLLQTEGKYPQAELYLRKAVATWERTSENGSIEIASAYNNLGQVLYLENKFDEAEGFYKKSYSVFLRKAKNSGELRSVVSNLAVLYEHQGKHNESIALFQETIAALEKSPSSNIQVEGL